MLTVGCHQCSMTDRLKSRKDNQLGNPDWFTYGFTHIGKPVSLAIPPKFRERCRHSNHTHAAQHYKEDTKCLLGMMTAITTKDTSMMT